MIDQEKFNHLAALAYDWARAQETCVLEHGVPLNNQQRADAERAGIRRIDRVRLLVVDRIPLPEDKELADAARRAQIITDASRAVAVGYAIIVRADSWHNRELLLHQLVHVAQCERSGGLEPFVRQYLFDRRNSPEFRVGSLEDEARSLAREICSGSLVS